MNNYYTYAYLREDKTPYYVGKGSKKRIYDNYGRPCKKPRDKSRIIFLKQNLTEEEAFKHEIYMIGVFGRKDLGTGILHNRTDGGEGTSGRYKSEEERRKISERLKGEGCYWYGKCHSLETKEKMSKSQKRRIHTEETKKKMSLSAKKIKRQSHSQDRIKKITNSLCKKVWYIKTITGEIIEVINLKRFCIENHLNVGHMSSRRKSKGYEITNFLELKS